MMIETHDQEICSLEAEIARLECSLKISQEKHRLCIERVKKLECGLHEIEMNTPTGNSVEGCRRVAREALEGE
jgi:hypothetical protein